MRTQIYDNKFFLNLFWWKRWFSGYEEMSDHVTEVKRFLLKCFFLSQLLRIYYIDRALRPVS